MSCEPQTQKCSPKYKQKKSNSICKKVIYHDQVCYGSAGKCNAGDLALIPGWVGKIPWRRERLPTPVFWPREFHGHSPQCHRVRHD